MSDERDRTILNTTLMRIGLEAIDSVADRAGVAFHDLDREGKRKFLEQHGKDVVQTCINHGGEMGRHFEDRVVLWVENGESAGLIFTKRKTK